jgi:AcrR family transcriptional regulator
LTSEGIIDAAFRVWGRELYQTTSLTQLARELGVSKPAIYRHFKSKQALLDAMYTRFFDDYAARLKDEYHRALGAENKTEGLYILMRALTAYYLRHVDAFIFSLFRIYGNRDVKNMARQLAERGMYMGEFLSPDDPRYPPKLQLIIATLTFVVASFYRFEQDITQVPSETLIAQIVARGEDVVSRGLGFKKELVDAVDFKRLEDLVMSAALEGGEEERILKAVAGVVAEVGPWNASMDMVARRSGMSKSGLYAHFKSKQDMLRQMFMVEIERIVAYVKDRIHLSAAPEEQLYLALMSVTHYLRSRPEILVVVDWLRIRRVTLGFADFPRTDRIFADICFGEPFRALTDLHSQWILFLLVNVMIRSSEGADVSALSNESVRVLYRFITLGIPGYDG